MTTRTPRVRGLMVWAAIAFVCAAAGCSGSGSETGVPVEAVAPAGQSSEVRAEVNGSTIAVRFDPGWYELEMPISGSGGRVIVVKDKLTYAIPVEFRNLGPRAVLPSGKFELKVNTGYVYSNQMWDSSSLLMDPGKTAGAVLKFEVPPGMTPVELNGEIGQTQFRLKVPAKPITETMVKVASDNHSNPFDTRSLKVLRCEMAGFGKNPTLTFEYENPSDKAIGVLVEILYTDTAGKIMGQGDLRGPIAPGGRENLVYRIATAPQNMIGCGLSLWAWDGRGIPPPGWPAAAYRIDNNFTGRPISEWVEKLRYPLIGPISGGGQKGPS